MPVKCPECHGEGGYLEPILYDGIGGGPIYDCGYCNGSGKVSQKDRMLWVRSFKGDYIAKT